MQNVNLLLLVIVNVELGNAPPESLLDFTKVIPSGHDLGRLVAATLATANRTTAGTINSQKLGLRVELLGSHFEADMFRLQELSVR